MPNAISISPQERALRFVLLCLLWGAWLSLRALWVLLEWLVSADGRRVFGRMLMLAALVAGIALLPKAAGLLWGRMMLQDAMEIAALQSQDRDSRELESALRQRAYLLGFTDIVGQPDAARVARDSTPEGETCRIELDFQHRVDLYGWAAPPLRIHLKVERPVIPRPPDPESKDFLS